MNMMKVIAVPMHPEGRKFVAIFAAVTAVLWLVWEPLFWLGLGMTVWCYYFFRDPVRSVAQRPGLILSPADGGGIIDHQDRPARGHATGR